MIIPVMFFTQIGDCNECLLKTESLPDFVKHNARHIKEAGHLKGTCVYS